jgi:Zn-dependent protease
MGVQDESVTRLERIGRLRAQLTDVLPDAETMWNMRADRPGCSGTRRAESGSRARSPQQDASSSLFFRGHLAVDSSQAYALLRERFAPMGYTPLLRQSEGYDIVVAIPRVFPRMTEGQLERKQWVPNLVLFLLTFVTTTLMGALMEQAELFMEDATIFFQKPWLILTGIPASLTIMGILGVHELAHYFVARRHGLDSSLPYFIPVPFGFGTFGAIIRIRTPWEDRRALFDVGVAGPLAGLLVALPLFFVGLLISPHMPPIPEATTLGSPLLLRWMESVVYAIRDIPEGHDIYVNAMTFAAWFGVIVTGFNLLPIGQLDGGHVAYAVLGRWAKWVGSIVLAGIIILGLSVWSGWLIWTSFILLSGWQHPAPLNALATLGRKRLVLGIAVFVLTILILTPAPFPI